MLRSGGHGLGGLLLRRGHRVLLGVLLLLLDEKAAQASHLLGPRLLWLCRGVRRHRLLLLCVLLLCVLLGLLLDHHLLEQAKVHGGRVQSSGGSRGEGQRGLLLGLGGQKWIHLKRLGEGGLARRGLLGATVAFVLCLLLLLLCGRCCGGIVQVHHRLESPRRRWRGEHLSNNPNKLVVKSFSRERSVARARVLVFSKNAVRCWRVPELLLPLSRRASSGLLFS